MKESRVQQISLSSVVHNFNRKTLAGFEGLRPEEIANLRSSYNYPPAKLVPFEGSARLNRVILEHSGLKLMPCVPNSLIDWQKKKRNKSSLDLDRFHQQLLLSSVMRQTDCNLLSRARALTTFARMSEARAVQMNGLGSRLWFST